MNPNLFFLQDCHLRGFLYLDSRCFYLSLFTKILIISFYILFQLLLPQLEGLSQVSCAHLQVSDLRVLKLHQLLLCLDMTI